MKLAKLISQLGHLPFFDLPAVVQLSGEDKRLLQTQLYRWRKSGKILSLRRGMYTFSETYRKIPINPARLANELYRPSYLSGLWALGFWGIIPEKVVTYTSVTPKVTSTFSNSFGTFQYSTVKQSYFFGFEKREMGRQKIWLADPEKALLDLWYLSKGEWSRERMLEMRFQQYELIQQEKLQAYTERFASPRLFRALDSWKSLVEEESYGTIHL